MAPPHFHEGNLANYPVNAIHVHLSVNACFHIKIFIIFISPKTSEVCFLIGELNIWIFMKARKVQWVGPLQETWETGSGFLTMVSIVFTTDWPITRKSKIELYTLWIEHNSLIYEGLKDSSFLLIKTFWFMNCCYTLY